MKNLCLALCATLLVSASAAAQDAPQLRDNRVTVNAAITWLGGYDIGGSAAQLRGNATGATAPPFTLMTSDSHFSSAAAPEIRVGFSLTPRLTLEGGASWSRPRVGVRIFGDAEAASQELPGEELQQYVFDGGVSWQLPIDLGCRLAPFATGGAGYLRQLHEDRTFAETGRIYYAGGGARYWLRGGHGNVMPIGLRGEFRVNLRRDGIDFEDKMRAYPTFSVFLFIGL
jgi:opacity protein-like surface antigen